MVPLYLARIFRSCSYGLGTPWSFGGGIGMMILSAVVPIAIIVLAVFLFRRFGRADRGSSASTSMEVLKRRYARGELSKEEFLEMKKTLREE